MIYIILGTKAQLIKMAPVMKSMQDRKIPYCFIHTGQHKLTMSDMYQDFGIKEPDIVLYEGSDITSTLQVFSWFSKLIWKTFRNRQQIFAEQKNCIGLVHGDTLSTLLGALIGRLAGIKVGHIESGLRSFNFFHPFPEELTRLMVFRLSHILYCPGHWAVDNVKQLNKEIVNTKLNTLIDTIRLSQNATTPVTLNFKKPFGLVSLHRYENIFKLEQLNKIVSFLEEISEKHQLLFIMHPPTKKNLIRFGLLDRVESNPHIICKDRFSHSKFLSILLKADFVITDGGSLQEETSYLGIPCLLFRQATERKEGLLSNVVLSKFKEDVIEDFVCNYQEYRSIAVDNDISPSDIVVSHIQKFI